MSQLELLPPEILLHLLTLLSHTSRRSLVHASPFLHAVYSANRRYFLQHHLITTFGPLLFDLYAVYQLQMLKPVPSPRTSPSFPPRLTALHTLLHTWSSHLTLRTLPPHLRLSVAESSYILVFYRRFVEPVREQMIAWSINRMPRTPKMALNSRPLSPSEFLRTTRAVYRFQLLCLLAGPDPSLPAYRELVSVMLDVIEPWEVAELLTVYNFASVTYRDVLSLAREDPGFFTTLSTPPGLPHPEDERAAREAVVLRGLVLLRTVLLDVTNQTQLAALLSTNLGRTGSQGLPGTQATTEALFRGQFPEEQRTVARPAVAAVREEMSARRSAFPFQGDYGAGEGAAPYAWTVLWRGTYSNVSAWSVPYGLKIWGWAFWDEGTVVEAGLMGAMEDEWKRRWGAADPRDVVDIGGWGV